MGTPLRFIFGSSDRTGLAALKTPSSVCVAFRQNFYYQPISYRRRSVRDWKHTVPIPMLTSALRNFPMRHPPN
jgi:hypothetical protein